MWETEEYATSRFRSVWRSVITAPQMTENPAMAARITLKSCACSGSSDSEILRRPYPPIFSSTPASITETAVGASVWASGSHVWTGKTGNFTRKASVIAQNTRPSGTTASAMGFSASSTMLNVPASRPMTRKPTSMNAEPASV